MCASGNVAPFSCRFNADGPGLGACELELLLIGSGFILRQEFEHVIWEESLEWMGTVGFRWEKGQRLGEGVV
jgi:hypothetical protein